jgi:murein DD-endopeptidase MepM/ murein hydrolase activator NlpD
VVVACTISLATGLVARADDVADQKARADRKIAALGQQLEGTNAALAKAYVNLEKTRAAIPVARQKVSQAQTALGRAQKAQAQAEATEVRAIAAEAKARAHNEAVAQKLADAQANEARASAKLKKSGAELATSQDALDAYAAEVFQGGGASESQLGMVFGSTSPQDFADRLVMADTASAVASDTIDRLAAMTADNTSTKSYLTSVRGEIAELKRQAEAALRSAEAASAAAATAREQAVVAKNNAVTATNNARTAKAELDSLNAKQTAYAGDLRQQRASEKEQLAAAEREAARLKAILAERARQAKIAEQKRLAKLKAEREAKIRAEQAKAAAAKKKGTKYTPKIPPPVQAPSTPSNYLSYPANGPTTSGFGMRWHPVLQKWMLHDGLDWGIACGTPIYAAAPGEVIRAGWRESGWGNQILIDHGIHRGVDLVTSYNHLSSIVKWGGSVRRGQLIGYSGTTGYSTGCHLHFGVYEDGTPVNPRGWL